MSGNAWRPAHATNGVVLNCFAVRDPTNHKHQNPPRRSGGFCLTEWALGRFGTGLIAASLPKAKLGSG
jgi:hypothetical protein